MKRWWSSANNKVNKLVAFVKSFMENNKSRIRETLNLSTHADSDTNTKTDKNGKKRQKKISV